VDASPPNLRDEMCGGKRHKPASDEDEEPVASNAGSSSGEAGITFFSAGLQPPMVKPSELMAQAPAASEPILVYTGPTRTGAALVAAVAADSEMQTPRRRVKKPQVAAKKPDGAADPKSDAKVDAKPAEAAKPAAKPATVRHANARPDAAAKPAEKPVAATADKPVAKPKPKAAAKPKDTDKPKPAPKSTTSEIAPPVQKPGATPPG
jgi:D-alanyl-D-alanine carboxypeptidase